MYQNSDRTKKCTKQLSDYANMCHNVSNDLLNLQRNNHVEFMKFSVVLDKRRAKASGLYSVRIRFNFDNQAYYVSTGVDVPLDNFVLGKVVNMPKAAILNSIIASKLEYTQQVIEDLKFRGMYKTVLKTGTEIKRFIEAGDLAYELLDRNERMKLHFRTYVENHALSYTSKSSAAQYKDMLKKVSDFSNLDTLCIPDINVGWLKDFESFCEKSGMSTNGIGVYMRAIRTIWNDAIDRDLIGVDKYPFRRFKIKKAATKHRNVTLADLRYMLNFDYEAYKIELKENSKKHTSVFPDIERYVDLFFLSFYFCGMNIKDILFLKREDIRNNQISILRYKTGEKVIIKIEPEAKRIISKYPGKKYLLNYMDNYTTDDYKNVEKKMNDNIKHVLSFISGYWARHSWATLAGELDIPDPIIDIAQGRNVPGMADTYIRRNIAKISDANRKVIDYLFDIKPETSTTP